MATVRDRLLPALEAGRTKVQQLGLRTSRVWIRHEVWDGGEVSLGNVTTTLTEILPSPRVETKAPGRVMIGPITPAFAGGGYTPLQLNPQEIQGENITLFIAGPGGTQVPYRATEFNNRSSFGYYIMAQSLERQRPIPSGG